MIKQKCILDQLEISTEKLILRQYFNYQYLNFSRLKDNFFLLKTQELQLSTKILKSPFLLDIKFYKNKILHIFDCKILPERKIRNKIKYNELEEIANSQKQYNKIIQKIFDDY